MGASASLPRISNSARGLSAKSALRAFVADLLDDLGDRLDGIEERVGFQLFAVFFAKRGDADLMIGGLGGAVDEARERTPPGNTPGNSPSPARIKRVSVVSASNMRRNGSCSGRVMLSGTMKPNTPRSCSRRRPSSTNSS